jgi:hypothetical protein
MKTVQGRVRGQLAFICPIRSVGFMSPISGCSGLAGLGVPGHQQGLQLLVGVGGGLVDVPEAVPFVGADLHGQCTQKMVEFCLLAGNMAYSELAFQLSEPGVWVMGPEVVDL